MKQFKFFKGQETVFQAGETFITASLVDSRNIPNNNPAINEFVCHDGLYYVGDKFVVDGSEWVTLETLLLLIENGHINTELNIFHNTTTQIQTKPKFFTRVKMFFQELKLFDHDLHLAFGYVFVFIFSTILLYATIYYFIHK